MIIGTAGHIDHGKSSLVRALTGATVDRLREEQARGITIDLNFAPLDLGNGRLAGVVDVPGHEDFIRTMVAGASGIDLVLLVVAADEGPMPQTAEHLSIVEQLAIPYGIPVVTKADLADPEWLELVVADLTARLADSPVAFEPVVSVSAASGAGISALRDAIVESARRIPERKGNDFFRMPIDRVFSMAGTGTVVTGTAWSGALSVGETVSILPARERGRVRTIQSHGHAVARSLPASRTAVGLAGVPRAGVKRGDILVRDGDPWTLTGTLDVELSLLPDSPRPLLSRSRVRIHHGTAEVMARVSPRGRIEPGGRGLARLLLEAPLVCRGGDRFVMRSYSPVYTIGGGRVLDPDPPRRRIWPEGLDAAEPAPRLEALLVRRPGGITLDSLPILLGVIPEEAAGFAGTGDRWEIAGDRLVSRERIEELSAGTLRSVNRYHEMHPSEPGIPLETLRSEMRSEPFLVAAALKRLVDEDRIAVEGGLARASGFEPAVTGGRDAIERVVEAVVAGGLKAPRVMELVDLLNMPAAGAALRIAERDGLVLVVEEDWFIGREAGESFVAVLMELGREGPITVAAVRDRLGLTRKYLIPLLEWADRTGVTHRSGEARALSRASQLSRESSPA
ncbi:MAG: selenocysteine-specific translation elongation factor [Gemmatimonadales bacterium]